MRKFILKWIIAGLLIPIFSLLFEFIISFLPEPFFHVILNFILIVLFVFWPSSILLMANQEFNLRALIITIGSILVNMVLYGILGFIIWLMKWRG